MVAQQSEVEWLLRQALRAISKLPPVPRNSYEVTVAAIELQLREAEVVDTSTPQVRSVKFGDNVIPLITNRLSGA